MVNDFFKLFGIILIFFKGLSTQFVLLASDVSDPNFECFNREGFFSDPYNCSNFYECVDGIAYQGNFF